MKHLIPINKFSAPTEQIKHQIANVGAAFVEVRVVDPRDISSEQRRKAWAIIGDIAKWSGDHPEWIHIMLKLDHCLKENKDFFSLSTCDMTTARLYINYLVDFCVAWNIPLRAHLPEMCDDLEAALYSSLLHKRCIVCGKKSDLHHVDRVGQGRDRALIIHKGMKVQPLCREHHSECHSMGQANFNSKYHLSSFPLDDYLCQIYGLGYQVEQGE